MKLSIQKICFILLFIVLSTIIMIYGGVILKPIAFALLAASIYLKPAQWVERRGIGRSWSIIIVMLTGSILVLSFGYFLANETVQVMTSLKSELSMDKPSQMIANEINDQVPNGWVQLTKDEVSNTFKNWMSDVGVPFLSDTFKSTGYILSSAILCLLYTFFLLLYRKGIAEAISHMGSQAFSQLSGGLLQKIVKTGQQYLTGLGLLIVLLAVLYGITFWLFGIDYPIVFAIVASTLAVIPYIGTTLGASLPVIYAYISYDNHLIAVGLIICIMTIQMLEGNFLTPKIVGGNMKLNPLASLLAVVVGSFIWGLAGMVLFLPLVAMAKIIFEQTDALKPLAELSGQDLIDPDHTDE